MEEKKEFKKPITTLPENTVIDHNFERMLKTFMKQVEKDGILQEVKERRYYIKPSMKKRLNKKSKRRN